MSVKKIAFILVSFSIFLVSCGGGGGTATAGGYGGASGGASEASTCASDYCITASGGKYYVNGTLQAPITITAGQTKVFDLSDSSLATHPFQLSTSVDGRVSGTVDTATQLGSSDGVTKTGTQGSTGAKLTIVTAATTKTPLYYFCTSHTAMGGTITISGGDSSGFEVTEKVQPIDVQNL